MAVNMDTKKSDDAPIYEKTVELVLLMVLSVGFSLGLYAGMPIWIIAAVISMAGEVFLWGGVVWLLLKSICKGKAFPFWRVSLFVSAVMLLLVGGLVP